MPPRQKYTWKDFRKLGSFSSTHMHRAEKSGYVPICLGAGKEDV